MIYKLVRQILFGMDPERSHAIVSGLGNHFLTMPGSDQILDSLLGFHSQRLTQNIMGIKFENPVGMAAGFDKTGALYPFLCSAGFGFVESGTFTAHAQDGNPKPRLFRYPRQRALINRMGFNNPGAKIVSKNIASQKRTRPRGINLGKSKITDLDDAKEDYIVSLRFLYPFADYIAVNVSSPNTPGLRELQSGHHLNDLLGGIKQELLSIVKKEQIKQIPLLVKIAPDMSIAELDDVISIVMDLSLDGIILTNTTLDHKAIPGGQDQQGGLSGLPVRQKSTDFIRHVYKLTSGQISIIGAGGIFSGADALEKIQAGASLLQIYTGYIYEGPTLPREINRYLNRAVIQAGLDNICELVGTSVK